MGENPADYTNGCVAGRFRGQSDGILGMVREGVEGLCLGF